jgi:hypothetical protein
MARPSHPSALPAPSLKPNMRCHPTASAHSAASPRAQAKRWSRLANLAGQTSLQEGSMSSYLRLTGLAPPARKAQRVDRRCLWRLNRLPTLHPPAAPYRAACYPPRQLCPRNSSQCSLLGNLPDLAMRFDRILTDSGANLKNSRRYRREGLHEEPKLDAMCLWPSISALPHHAPKPTKTGMASTSILDVLSPRDDLRLASGFSLRWLDKSMRGVYVLPTCFPTQPLFNWHGLSTLFPTRLPPPLPHPPTGPHPD